MTTEKKVNLGGPPDGGPVCDPDWTHGLEITSDEDSIKRSVSVLRNTSGAYCVVMDTEWTPGTVSRTSFALSPLAFDMLLTALREAAETLDKYPILTDEPSAEPPA